MFWRPDARNEATLIPLGGNLDLGDGHSMSVTQHGEPPQPVGFIDSHRRPDGKGTCGGALWIDTPYVREHWPDRPKWTLTGEWPAITLSPSLLCTACGDHGFVR